MSRQQFFIGGLLHRTTNFGNAFGGVKAQGEDGVIHEYVPVLMTIAGAKREIFVLKGYDLEKAHREAIDAFGAAFSGS